MINCKIRKSSLFLQINFLIQSFALGRSISYRVSRVWILSNFSTSWLKLTLNSFYFWLITLWMNSEVYEKLCLLWWELVFLFFRMKTAMPTRLYFHIPQPEKPEYSLASVLRNKLRLPISMILDTTTLAIVGRTSSNLSKMFML